MTAFSPLPLGRRIPDLPHAVSCSIPTLHDLRGYEEKWPETMSRMCSGYPRFVVHPMARKLGTCLSARAGLGRRRLWLTCSGRVAQALVAYLPGSDARLFYSEGVSGVDHADEPELSARAKTFLQHTGGFLSSREAEDVLVRLGELPGAEPEAGFAGDASAESWRQLGPLFDGAGREDAFFTNSGINAVYSAFRTVDELQAQRGRHLWVQLGWLYLDTIAILRKFTRPAGSGIVVRDVGDRACLERLFAEQGPRIAGLIAEVPTNPLIQTPDVRFVADLARRHGARLLLDPSVASAYSVDLLQHADIVVASLTKFSAHEGDVIAGLAVVNRAGPDADALRRRLGAVVEPLYPRDFARLAAQLGRAPAATARIQKNVATIAAFLESRPEVSAVHWSGSARTRAAYAAVARGPECVGGMLSFELKVPMQAFFDAVRLPKGPSFGMCHTLLCPFIWMAHYDLVTSPEGREELAASGINPDLMRLSPGTESTEDIISALAEALDLASGRRGA